MLQTQLKNSFRQCVCMSSFPSAGKFRQYKVRSKFWTMKKRTSSGFYQIKNPPDEWILNNVPKIQDGGYLPTPYLTTWGFLVCHIGHQGRYFKEISKSITIFAFSWQVVNIKWLVYVGYLYLTVRLQWVSCRITVRNSWVSLRQVFC